MNIQTHALQERRSALAERGLQFIYAAAALSVALSVGLWLLGLREAATFVAIWVPSVLSLPWALAGRAALVPLAAASMALSIGLWFFIDKPAGLFVGIWVPSILSYAGMQRSE